MTALLLCLAFFLPVGSIARTMYRDEADCQAERDIARITAALAPERDSLLPEDFHDTWPQRQTPSDLPPRVGLIVAVDRPGRHAVGTAVGTTEQQALWNSPTGQFNTLVAATWTDDERQSLSREWWCLSCEDDHKDCAGLCACPCTLVAVA